MKLNEAKAVDDYIKSFPKNVQKLLRQMRRAIRGVVPQAQETIKYGMPTYVLRKNLVHFAGYKHHIGFYPGSEAIVVFKKSIVKYKSSKGAIQFPLHDPLPLDLILKIVKYRVAQGK